MTQQTIIKKPKKWGTPLKSKDFFTFDKIGDTLEGMITSIDDSNDKMVFYTMQTFEGTTKKFHGTAQLDDILSQLSVPVYVKITYVGTQDVGKGTMKVFEVLPGEN